MNVVVVIEGREAIPVRAIPFLTDWSFLYPDSLAHTLAGTGGETQSLFGELHAYRREGGKVIGIPERWWANFAVTELTALGEQIKSDEPSHEVGNQQWRDESLAKLRGGAFVWKDELEAFHRANWDRRARLLSVSFSQDDEGEPNPSPGREIYEILQATRRKLDSWRELDFSPWLIETTSALVMDGFKPEHDLLNQTKRELRSDHIELHPRVPVTSMSSAAPVVAERASGEPAGPPPLTMGDTVAVPNWKMRVQTEATALCKRLQGAGANPTKSSILKSMAMWCRDNEVKTNGNIFPSENYLRTHVLGGKHWDVPS